MHTRPPSPAQADPWVPLWGVRVAENLPPALRNWLHAAWGAWWPSAWAAAPYLACVQAASGWPPAARCAAPEGAAARTLLPHSEAQGLPVWLQCLPAGQGWRLSSPQGWCHLHGQPQQAALLQVGGADPRVPLYLALTEVFRAAGWVTLHASAHAAADGAGVLSLGRSGAGKSYRLLQALQQGLQPLGEDRVFVRAADGLMLARDTHLRLKPEAAALWPALRPSLAAPGADGKCCLPWHALAARPAAPRPVARVELLMGRAPQPADAAACITPLLATQAIWEATGLPFCPPAQQSVGRVVNLLLQLPLQAVWRPAATAAVTQAA